VSVEGRLTAIIGLAMLRGVRRSFAIAVCAVLALGTPSAGAQGNPAATQLFEEGRALAEQGKYEEACDRYAKSYELERAAGTMLNLGDCAERAGELRRAWLMYDAAAHEYEKAGKTSGARFARERADALAPRLATVVVRLADPLADGLTVRIGGRVVESAPEIVERLEAGAVPIEVGAPGREPFATTAKVEVGAQVVVDVPALRSMDGGPVPRPPLLDRPARSRRQRGRVLIAAGVAGAGVLGLAAAGAFALGARSAYGDYEAKLEALGCDAACSAPDYAMARPLYDRAAQRADLATGFVIGGAALVAGGALIYLTAPRERVTVTPIASAGAVGAAATIRF